MHWDGRLLIIVPNTLYINTSSKAHPEQHSRQRDKETAGYKKKLEPSCMIKNLSICRPNFSLIRYDRQRKAFQQISFPILIFVRNTYQPRSPNTVKILWQYNSNILNIILNRSVDFSIICYDQYSTDSNQYNKLNLLKLQCQGKASQLSLGRQASLI